MKLIYCLDKKKGLSLFGKRLSRDEVLYAYLVKTAQGAPFWMNTYSAGLVPEFEGKQVDDAFLQKAGEEDWCFVENIPCRGEMAKEIILCHWNRQYPADVFFTEDLKALGFARVLKEDLVGKSHDKITVEHYRRKE